MNDNLDLVLIIFILIYRYYISFLFALSSIQHVDLRRTCKTDCAACHLYNFMHGELVREVRLPCAFSLTACMNFLTNWNLAQKGQSVSIDGL